MKSARARAPKNGAAVATLHRLPPASNTSFSQTSSSNRLIPSLRVKGVARPSSPVLFGAIDVGTSSIHLIMVEIHPDGDFRVLGRDKEMVNLGSGGFERRVLTARAMKQGLSTISRFQKMARLKGITRIKAVATSAVREASNGGEFVKRVRDELGLEVRVISGEEEARLVYLAVRHAVDLGANPNLLLDIGGGSVELVMGHRERAQKVYSLKLGSLRLLELFLNSDPPTAKEFRALRRHIGESLRPIVESLSGTTFSKCIGTSGAVQHLAGLCALRRGHPKADAPTTLSFSRAELKSLMQELCALTRVERTEVPGMDHRRIDTVIPSGIVIHGVMRMLNLARIDYCDMGLREGIILDHISGQRGFFLDRALWPDPRARSVRQLGQRCGYRRTHAEQVAKLALSLFDQLADLHRLRPWHREMLAHAALLHDIGYLISHKGHHKHSYYLIRNGGLYGFAEDEVEMIANIARYHRKARPRRGDFSFDNLSPRHRPALRQLVSVLRLANALDRTHFSVVDSIRCRRMTKGIRLEAQTTKDAELELWTARRQIPYFEREFGVELDVRCVGSPDRTKA